MENKEKSLIDLLIDKEYNAYDRQIRDIKEYGGENASDFYDWNHEKRAKLNLKRINLLTWIKEKNIPIKESKVDGCVEAIIQMEDKQEPCIIALKGKVKFKNKDWCRYTVVELKKLLKKAI